ncbi:hypothetical protein FAI41_03180 [Acetobacteraceae bacterium]|nr:hypothetical protein FAI41_03180 [Acetobacteraceae bacterium]
MRNLLPFSFLALLLFSETSFAQNRPCLKKQSFISCLQNTVRPFSFQTFPHTEAVPAHGIRLVMINGQVALLKLSLPRLQYQTLCRKLGITFARRSLPL